MQNIRGNIESGFALEISPKFYKKHSSLVCNILLKHSISKGNLYTDSAHSTSLFLYENFSEDFTFFEDFILETFFISSFLLKISIFTFIFFYFYILLG
jgi:hypothetical protein